MSHYDQCLLAARCIGGVNDPEHRMFGVSLPSCLDCGESCQCALIGTVLDGAVQRVEAVYASHGWPSGVGDDLVIAAVRGES